MATISLSKSEKAYIQSSITASSSLRADGRELHDYRAIALETGVAPLANGSARLNIGKVNHEPSGGTEVLAATKLEVEDIENGDGVEGGRIVCSVSCSPSAYPHVSYTVLDDLQYDYTTLMQDILAHPSLHPPNLGILRGKKSWLLALDLVVLSDSGNIYDALFMAARAALWDTKVPRTRSVEYRANGGRAAVGNDMDVDQEKQSGLDTRQVKTATDFELEDYWDEGEPLGGREKWPVCITLNLLPPLHYLDATLQEEAATPLRLLLMYSFKPQTQTFPALQGMRLIGTDDIDLTQISGLIKDGEKHAGELFTALNAKLKEEDIRRTEKARRRFAAVR